MKKLKVVSVVGTRPEIIRLSRVMAELDASPSIDHVTIHTGQNYDYELNEIFYNDMGLRKPDYYLNAAGETSAETIGQIIIKIDALLQEINPDAFLVLGDTNSCLSAIAAKKRRIPIFHMEAGNRCFDQRVPEETNRKIVDHIADINLTYSDISREYLLREGLQPDRIIKTGSPMYEVIHFYEDKINGSKIMNELGLERNKYFVVSSHREENVSDTRKFNQFLDVLNEIVTMYGYPMIISTHPRTRKKLESIYGSNFESIEKGIHETGSNSMLMRWMPPLSFSDYVHLQKNSFAVFSDSGTLSEESSILNFKALNIRDTHERPEAMEEASVMLVGFDKDKILQGLHQLSNQEVDFNRNFHLVKDYQVDNVSKKVVRIIISYTEYVNKYIWHK